LVPSSLSAWGVLRKVSEMPSSLLGGALFDSYPRAAFAIAAANLAVLTSLLATSFKGGGRETFVRKRPFTALRGGSRRP